MAGREYTNEEAAAIVEAEGIGYAVTCYADAGSMADPETANLWARARAALDMLSAHLAPYSEGGGEE